LAGSGIKLTVDIDPTEARRLETAPQWAEQLLLLTNEAAANVLRHSGADRLELSFRREEGQGIWSVKDNGRGFSLEAAGGQGMGLTSLKHRAGSLPGGRLSFDSAEGRGTTVTVRFDLW
jgi:signal transduction histidine kinase